jgi:hypothetical protein
MRRALWWILVSAFVFPAARTAAAQSQPTDLVLQGIVLDSMRAPIPGAQITATSGSESTSASAITDQRGAFMFSLKAGQYTVRVHVDGFRDAARRSGKIRSPPRRPSSVPPVAGVREAVTVTAPGGLSGAGHHHRDQDADTAARRRRRRPSSPRTDQRPDDDEASATSWRAFWRGGASGENSRDQSSFAATARRRTSSSTASATTSR